MVKRWNTGRIALWGVAFGVVYSLLRVVVEFGWPKNMGATVFFVSHLVGGAVGGAVLFALVSGVRNLVLRAK